jgi:hypothetical protein
MMEDIFDNILVYIPIILIVLVNVLRMRKSGAGKKPVAKKAAGPADRPVVKPVPAPQKSQERRSRKEPPRINKPLAPEPVLFPEIPSSPAAPVQPVSGHTGGGFPENLSYLPALKRAVVLAEIMGPPKGLSGGMGKTGFEPPGGMPSCGP